MFLCTRHRDGDRAARSVWADTGCLACAQQASQHTLPEDDDVRPSPAEKSWQSALRGRLSLDNGGPSMWPYLSSSFYGLPPARAHGPCGRPNGSVSLDLCWWLRDPWSSLAPNDLLSVVTSLGHTPDPACALGAC